MPPIYPGHWPLPDFNRYVPDPNQYGRTWSIPAYAPQPWECPRCKKIHGPQSMACDCKPHPTQEADK